MSRSECYSNYSVDKDKTKFLKCIRDVEVVKATTTVTEPSSIEPDVSSSDGVSVSTMTPTPRTTSPTPVMFLRNSTLPTLSDGSPTMGPAIGTKSGSSGTGVGLIGVLTVSLSTNLGLFILLSLACLLLCRRQRAKWRTVRFKDGEDGYTLGGFEKHGVQHYTSVSYHGKLPPSLPTIIKDIDPRSFILAKTLAEREKKEKENPSPVITLSKSDLKKRSAASFAGSVDRCEITTEVSIHTEPPQEPSRRSERIRVKNAGKSKLVPPVRRTAKRGRKRSGVIPAASAPASGRMSAADVISEAGDEASG